ncbi:MAG: histidine phosphatase family protein [Chitinispirillaceae bacterium]|nr:histidine phosphatase family protein [Chitinispirillaceae bacterium]
MRFLQLEFFLICLTCSSIAQVSITGIVKNMAGKEISGADITLVNKASLLAKSRTDGTFALTETAVQFKKKAAKKKMFRVLKNRIEFSSDLTEKRIAIGFHTLNGKRVFLKHFDMLQQHECSIDISSLTSGVYIVTVLADGIEYSFRYSNVTTNNLTETFVTKQTQRKTTLLKIMAVVDTLVVTKSGYESKKTPLGSYSQKNVEVVLDTSDAGYKDSVRKGLTVYFIRHAETVANASGEQGGSGPIENHDTLTASGEKQVQELKDYLIKENIKPDLIIVSPALRAQKTIEPFLTATKSTAQIWVELNECCGQEPTGDPLPTERPDAKWKLKINKYTENFSFRTSDDIYFWYPQSYEEGLFMVMTARDRLLQLFSQSGKTVIAVGHAVNGGIFLGLLRGYDMITTEPSRPVYLMNTGIHKLTQDTVDGTFTLKQNINNPLTR